MFAHSSTCKCGLILKAKKNPSKHSLGRVFDNVLVSELVLAVFIKRPQSESNWRLMPADYAEFECVVNINIFKAIQRKDIFNAEAQRRRERKEKSLCNLAKAQRTQRFFGGFIFFVYVF